MGMRTSAAEQALLFSFTLDATRRRFWSGIWNKSLIYHLFIAEVIHFTSVMKDVVGKEAYDFITNYA